jgi:hypothetical protein
MMHRTDRLRRPAHAATVALVALALAAAGSKHSDPSTYHPNLKPGQYAVSGISRTEGMGGFTPPPTKTTECIKAEELGDVHSMIRRGFAKTNRCSVTSIKVTGDTVSYDYACERSHGKGEQTYQGTWYLGSVDMILGSAPHEMKVTVVTTAKRIGDC